MHRTHRLLWKNYFYTTNDRLQEVPKESRPSHTALQLCTCFSHVPQQTKLPFSNTSFLCKDLIFLLLLLRSVILHTLSTKQMLHMLYVSHCQEYNGLKPTCSTCAREVFTLGELWWISVTLFNEWIRTYVMVAVRSFFSKTTQQSSSRRTTSNPPNHWTPSWEGAVSKVTCWPHSS